MLVSADPGHKRVATQAPIRLRLAQAAFPDDEVMLDPHPRTVETLRAHPEWGEAIFLLGADQFCDFESWVEPDEILRRTRVGVATRPGFPRERLEAVLGRLRQPERVLFFEIEPTPVASRDLRERLAVGADVRDALPAAVAEIVEREGLYRREPGYTRTA